MEIRYGRKLIDALGSDELGSPAHVICSPEMKSAAKVVELGGGAVSEVEVLDRAGLERVAGLVPGAKTVVALGGDEVLEAGRYAAWRTGSRLIAVPTPLESGSFASGRVTARESGFRTVVGDKFPDLALVDFGLIWACPEDETRQAVGEILSILTAAEDWKRSDPEGAEAYDEKVAEEALVIVSEVMDRADDIFDLTETGIKSLAEGMAARERLALRLGHRRVIEGSEHVLADCLEARAGRPLPRGAALSLAVVLMMHLQGKNPRPAKQFLHWVSAPWMPEMLGLGNSDLAGALTALPEFARKSGLGDSIMGEAELPREAIAKAIVAMREAIIRNSLQDRTD